MLSSNRNKSQRIVTNANLSAALDRLAEFNGANSSIINPASSSNWSDWLINTCDTWMSEKYSDQSAANVGRMHIFCHTKLRIKRKNICATLYIIYKAILNFLSHEWNNICIYVPGKRDANAKQCQKVHHIFGVKANVRRQVQQRRLLMHSCHGI